MSLSDLFKRNNSKSKPSFTIKKEIPPYDQWGAKTDQKRILLDLGIPFIPSVYDVIYVENEHDSVINNYIQEHFDELCKKFAEKQLVFNYLPKLNEHMVPNEVLHYMFPYLKPEVTANYDNITLEMLEQHITSGAIVSPAFIHFIEMGDEDKHYYFSYLSLVPDSHVSLDDQIEWYIKYTTFNYRGEEVYYSIIPPSGDDTADGYFDDNERNDFRDLSDYTLEKEIRERVLELRRRGFKMGLLHEFIEETPTLSRLVVDKDYRIFLPDYNNMEIEMSPLPKALYLLFLKHPEGIMFKELRDYRQELLDIYKKVSNRVIEDNIRSSIIDITDPTKNSVNEKCTRIREAFVKKFDSVYAKQYYITGKRGEPKKITLPRELVDLQDL